MPRDIERKKNPPSSGNLKSKDCGVSCAGSARAVVGREETELLRAMQKASSITELDELDPDEEDVERAIRESMIQQNALMRQFIAMEEERRLTPR